MSVRDVVLGYRMGHPIPTGGCPDLTQLRRMWASDSTGYLNTLHNFVPRRLSSSSRMSEFSLDKGRGYMEIESRLQMMRVALSHNWLASLRI